MRLPRLGTSGTQAHFILEKKAKINRNGTLWELLVYFGAPEEDFKSIFDLKITLITRANSLKILQTTEIHYWLCNPTEPVSREGQIFGKC